jgi:hypothetical protein
VTDEELIKLLIRHKPPDKIVHHCGECVVTTDTFVERFLLRLGRRRTADRQQQGKYQS